MKYGLLLLYLFVCCHALTKDENSGAKKEKKKSKFFDTSNLNDIKKIFLWSFLILGSKTQNRGKLNNLGIINRLEIYCNHQNWKFTSNTDSKKQDFQFQWFII